MGPPWCGGGQLDRRRRRRCRRVTSACKRQRRAIGLPEPVPVHQGVHMTTYGLLIFDGAGELDFTGPREVFTASRMLRDHADNAVLIAERPDAISCRKGMRVLTGHTRDDHPPLDVLVAPGGAGIRGEVSKPAITGWIRKISSSAAWTTSVCTGALLLHEAGPARGRKVATHHAFEDTLQARGDITVIRDAATSPASPSTADTPQAQRADQAAAARERWMRVPHFIRAPKGVVAGQPGAQRGSSATPCATAHGAHSRTSTSPSCRVMTALPSHTPMSSGCAWPHGQWQRRQSPASAERPASIAARTAGSSLPSASVVAAVTRRAHSPSAAAAASRAAANCRTGSSPSPAMPTSSHPAPAVASAPPAPLVTRSVL